MPGREGAELSALSVAYEVPGALGQVARARGSARTLHPAPRQGRSEGYTLVELLVSLVILGTLWAGWAWR